MHALTMTMITFNPTERRSTLTPPLPHSRAQKHDVDVTKCCTASDIINAAASLHKTKRHHAFFKATVVGP